MIPLHILGWTEGQTDRGTEGRTEVKQYTPCPVEQGYNQNIGVQLSLFQNKFMVKKLPLNSLFLYITISYFLRLTMLTEWENKSLSLLSPKF